MRRYANVQIKQLTCPYTHIKTPIRAYVHLHICTSIGNLQEEVYEFFISLLF